MREVLMSQYRQLHRAFWDSDYVEDELDEQGTLLYVYLITSPKSNMEGLYKCSLNRICRQTKLDREVVQKWFNRFERDGYAGWLKGWVCVTQSTNHMPNSPPMMTHARKVYEETPEDIMVWALSIGYIVPERIEYRMPNQQRHTVSGRYLTRLDNTRQDETGDYTISSVKAAVGLAPIEGANHGKKQRGG